MHDEKQIWRSHLQTALASEFNSGQVTAMMKDYDLLASKMSSETAFSIAHNSWSGSNTEKAVKTVKDYIAAQLGEFNAGHPGVDKNSSTRLRKIIQTLNENLSKCRVAINGVDVSEEMISKATIRIPPHLKPTIYEARASQSSKPSLVIEVTI